MKEFKPYPKKGMPLKKPKVGLKRTPLKKLKNYKIKKISKKKSAEIVKSKAYYELAINQNKKQNRGKCICENCGDEIKNPTGRNVSHIISGGANSALYLDMLNHFILCFFCENTWTNEDKTTMGIYEESEIRKEKLNHKYYELLHRHKVS